MGEDLTTLQYLLIGAIIVLFITLTILFVIKSRHKKPSLPDVDAIISALIRENIESIDYQRNKLVIKVRRAKDVDLDALKSTGAIGINVVGNKIKFYYEENNEAIYQSLKQVEGND